MSSAVIVTVIRRVRDGVGGGVIVCVLVVLMTSDGERDEVASLVMLLEALALFEVLKLFCCENEWDVEAVTDFDPEAGSGDIVSDADPDRLIEAS